MRSTTAVRLSILLALLAVPADALGANTIRTSSVTRSLVVPSGSPSTIRLHCPPTAVALNGAITRRGAGVAVLGSKPGRDHGSWSFRAAASGAGSRSISAVLRCVRLEVPTGLSGVRLHVRTRISPEIAIAPGDTATERLGCGRAWTATGYALSGGGDAVRLARAVPGAHGWRFTLENTGSSTVRAVVSARCLRTNVTATRSRGGTAELRFGVVRRSFSAVFPPGRGQIDATACTGGRFSLAAGGSLDPASPIELVIASPVGQSAGRWRVVGGSGRDEFTVYTVCLARGSAFN